MTLTCLCCILLKKMVLIKETLRNKVDLGSFSKSVEGTPLKFERMKVDNFKIDDRYQRSISTNYIKKGGVLNLSRLTPIFVCRRPDSLPQEDSGYYVVDGQHRCCRIIHSVHEDDVPVVVYEHPENTSLEECIKTEANLFYKLNTLGKKPTKLEEIRAGIYSQDPESLHVLDCMEILNLKCDNFGSEEEDAREIDVFYHFWMCCVKDYRNNGMNKLVAGLKLLDEVYPEENIVNGYAIRAFCLLSEFIDSLKNGMKNRFEEYIFKNLKHTITLKILVKGRTSAQSPQYILHKIIGLYNNSPLAENYKITPNVLFKVSSKDCGGNPRFRNPDDNKK